jgi:hypothetical protein
MLRYNWQEALRHSRDNQVKTRHLRNHSEKMIKVLAAGYGARAKQR